MTVNSKDSTNRPAKRGQGAGEALRMQMASVLVVDDEQRIRKFLKGGLEKYFGLVETAADSISAESLRQRCHFDLIITDIRLSGVNGLEWISDLRRQGISTGVIFITAEADLQMAISALRLDAVDFILKPFRLDQIMAALQRYLLRQQFQRNNNVLTRPVDHVYTRPHLIGNCEQISNICQIIKRVAPMPSTVLIEGESGTGKELAARAMHELSGRSGCFVPINCGAMSAELLESELFGHQKGAFTGAHQTRDGLFICANKGTLFLDEIGEMTLSMQAHLLRVLEERSIRPVGTNQQVPVDVRIVAATNRDLSELVRNGSFRQDIYYRLNVLVIRMPTLRDRLDDIPVLTQHFHTILAAELGMQAPSLKDDEIKRLCDYDWPGNVRELKNVIERSLLLNTLPSHCISGSVILNQEKMIIRNEQDLRLDAVEKHHILSVLKREGGNKSAAARVLGVSRKTLERKVQAWGLN